MRVMATLTIDLPPEVKARLEEIAEERQKPVPECARELLVAAMRVHDRETVTVIEGDSVTRVPDPASSAALAAIAAAAGSRSYVRRYLPEVMRDQQDELVRE